jgi:zinc D-Ala-D-Ala carboxypeptidase
MSDPIRTFRHFRDVPDGLWRWKNFSPAEIACRGTEQLNRHSPSGLPADVKIA